jgi:ribulose-5-phosphate 4-epimerase/fuculose-1-phosphate aldolase
MEQLVNKYAQKLIDAGLASTIDPFRPLIGGLDHVLVWNRSAPETQLLTRVFQELNINSLVCLAPCEPYASIIRYLACTALGSDGIIYPSDCETRTFLHDLPVIDQFDADKIVSVLKKRKCVIVQQGYTACPFIIADGTVSPEQGFVTISSVCFAGFVKYFSDFLFQIQTSEVSFKAQEVFDHIASFINPINPELPDFIKAPFNCEETVYKAIIQAGQFTVSYSLVDSYFGNVSYAWNDTLYISQTGSSLDELAACIDPVPFNGTSSAGLTASSELSAHLSTIEKTGCKAILHGHPKFSVILSMDCDPDQKAACQFKDQCHIKCPEKREIDSTPIVPGEVGTGPKGLCNTLPEAFDQDGSVIVYGHGVFTVGHKDFETPFKKMVAVENRCFDRYFEKIKQIRNG